MPTATPQPVLETALTAHAPVATLSNITQKYGNHVALSNVSMALQPGEVVALLGPNGAGKTTAVKLMLGLLAPTTGQASIFGQNPRNPAARTRIGAMLQVARVPETLKVREYIDLFRSYYPAPLPEAQIIASAGLTGIEQRKFSELSGGQRQRLLFGLALTGNPDLLFLDEPTLGMDIETRHALWQQVRDLAAAGKTILLTTHYLEEADSLANRIIVINKGQIIAEGTPTEIKSNVSGRKIRCSTTLDQAFLRTLPTVSSVTTDRGTTTITATDAETVIREMLLRDTALTHLEVTSPALEDAFLALTKSTT